MLLEEKLVVTKQDIASKDTFFWIDLIFQSNIGLKISHVCQSVTYYLNGPLNETRESADFFPEGGKIFPGGGSILFA